MDKRLNIRPAITSMTGYVPGEQPKGFSRLVKLNTNENPYPPSPKVAETLRNFDSAQLRRYPSPMADDMRKAVAERLGVTPEMVICCNGSDDLLTITARCFLDGTRPVAYPVPTYSLYKSLAELQGAPRIEIPLNEDFSLPDDFEKQAEGASIAMIACPNAPTGNRHSFERMEKLCRDFNGAVLIDEAYADFASVTLEGLVKKYPNVILSRTFSKSRALAGLRFGYAVAAPEVISEMMKAKDSYNVSMLTQKLALAAFLDTEYLAVTVGRVKAGREKLNRVLSDMGFRIVPSETNFLFASPPDGDGEGYFRFLRERGIIVRYFPGARTGAFVRITIGTEEEISILCDSTREYLKSK